MTSHSLVIPVMDQLHETKGILYLLKEVTDPKVEFVFIDNGSEDNWEKFIYSYLKPKKVQYIRNNKNIGLVKTMQQAYEKTESDILTYIHNDVYIFDNDWVEKVEELHKKQEIGAVGLYGSPGVFPDGGRAHAGLSPGKPPGLSAMIEAEVHGQRISHEAIKYVSIFDGFFMSLKRELLDKTQGFDTRYKWHHFYDRDICLESLRHGYKNVVYGARCHHVSGRTANQSKYQEMIAEKYPEGQFDHTKSYTGDKATHDDNMHRFKTKWGEVTPLLVDPQTGDYINYRMFKGNKIVGYEE